MKLETLICDGNNSVKFVSNNAVVIIEKVPHKSRQYSVDTMNTVLDTTSLFVALRAVRKAQKAKDYPVFFRVVAR